MPLHWQPVGPLPDAVYWRRRAAVAAATVVVLAIAATPLLGGSDDDVLGTQAPTAGSSPDPAGRSPDPAAAPTADPTASPGAPAACAEGALEVTAGADAASYPVGATARLELSVRNAGTVPCLTALGQGAVELVVTSGDDRIWSSDDCAPGGEQGEVLLEPGAVETARASWPTVRSAPGCPPDQPQALPGTYRVNARVGALQAAGAAFTLTG